MKIKNGTEEQDSKIPRISKAKAFVGILDIQNVLHLSQSNWKNIHSETISGLNNIKCLLNFADL